MSNSYKLVDPQDYTDSKWTLDMKKPFVSDGKPQVTVVSMEYNALRKYCFASPPLRTMFGIQSAQEEVDKYDTRKLVLTLNIPDTDKEGNTIDTNVAFKNQFRSLSKKAADLVSAHSTHKDLWGPKGKKSATTLLDVLIGNKGEIIRPAGTSDAGKDYAESIKLRLKWNYKEECPNLAVFVKNDLGKFEPFQGNVIDSVPPGSVVRAVFGDGQICKVKGNMSWTLRFKLLQVFVLEMGSSGGSSVPLEPLINMDMDMDTTSFGTSVTQDNNATLDNMDTDGVDVMSD